MNHNISSFQERVATVANVPGSTIAQVDDILTPQVKQVNEHLTLSQESHFTAQAFFFLVELKNNSKIHITDISPSDR